MNTVELRNMSATELKASVETLRREQFKLRLKKATGELVQTHKIKIVRRDIARHEMVLAEKTNEEGRVS